MSVVSFWRLLCCVNASCASMLFRFRKGDSNRSSVWICSRNDAIANILVIGVGIMPVFYRLETVGFDGIVNYCNIGIIWRYSDYSQSPE